MSYFAIICVFVVIAFIICIFAVILSEIFGPIIGLPSGENYVIAIYLLSILCSGELVYILINNGLLKY